MFTENKMTWCYTNTQPAYYVSGHFSVSVNK